MNLTGADTNQKDTSMMFRKDKNFIYDDNNRPNNAYAGGDGQSVPTAAQLRRSMHRQICLIMVSVLVAGMSTGAFLSRAWYASNRQVESTNSSITSDTPSPSLYIRPVSEKSDDKKYATAVTRDLGASLYPISTNDLESWYYASGFTFGEYTITTGTSGTSASVSIEAPVASEFTKATDIILDAATGSSGEYTNTFEEKTRTAYYYSADNLYTTSGDLDIYLNPDDPIRVELSTAAGKENFRKAVRVGIRSGGTFLIYAPVAETASGNTTGDSDTNYKAIAADTSGAAETWKLVSPAATVDDAGLATYKGVKAAGSDKTYTAGTAKLCTATEAGADVEVYVWLEGTDSAAMVGMSDGDSVGVKVNISYVGVVPSGT